MPQNSPWNDTQFVLAATLVVVLLVTLVLAVEGGMLGEFRFFPKGRFAISPEKPSQVQIIQPSQIQSVSVQSNENIYVYGAGKVAQLQSTGIKYFHNDYLGTPRVETNANKNIVAQNNQYPFGEVLSSAGNERYRFTGKESDDSGLMYFSARFYDSSTGRFTQVDPAGIGYAYTGSNPLRYVDPTGMQYGEIRRVTSAGKAWQGFKNFWVETAKSTASLAYWLFMSSAYPEETRTQTAVNMALYLNEVGGVYNAVDETVSGIFRPYIHAARGDPYFIGQVGGEISLGLATAAFGAFLKPVKMPTVVGLRQSIIVEEAIMDAQVADIAFEEVFERLTNNPRFRNIFGINLGQMEPLGPGGTYLESQYKEAFEQTARHFAEAVPEYGAIDDLTLPPSSHVSHETIEQAREGWETYYLRSHSRRFLDEIDEGEGAGVP